MPVALTLRQGLLEIAAARTTQAGQQSKADQVYHYLTGSRFKRRIEAIIERFKDMREDIDKERKFMVKAWATVLHHPEPSPHQLYRLASTLKIRKQRLGVPFDILSAAHLSLGRCQVGGDACVRNAVVGILSFVLPCADFSGGADVTKFGGNDEQDE